MTSKHARLDRFISRRTGVSKRSVKPLLAQQRIWVDGQPATGADQRIGQFSRVLLDGEVLQAQSPRYLMMNKPAGVVSATRDARHTTLLDLLDEGEGNDLHLAGRLDFNSTGLVLLTNDGRWSRWLSAPETKIIKRYRVLLRQPVTADMIHAFSQGIYFAYEDLVTEPATLAALESERGYLADVGLVQGRYHQIKRMFGKFNNEVLALHRCAVGSLSLDGKLQPGASCDLEAGELSRITDSRGQNPLHV